ncbi:hypothetical protein DFH09DRAFT_1414148 [Mycena vulgaris]|nr:hypothetical protein DFH09DRAFT_1414148 [Mycena vulgaris]
MRYILSTISISVAVASVSAFHIQEPGPHERRSSNTCGDPSDALPFYRIYKPTAVDHIYTTDVNWVHATTSYPLQGVTALVFVTQERPTVPLYRPYSTALTNNFYTISTTDRDSALKKDTISSLKIHSPTFIRLSFYTTSGSERLDFITNQGYTDIEIAGYEDLFTYHSHKFAKDDSRWLGMPAQPKLSSERTPMAIV